ncbi:TerD family protein [Kitasatospora camelliae]|uniref:TerD family protein n=1 Tax=Kitasatospora camelliae TaxID=3156397 RepID=A0AAU8JZS4_9ACTN
MVRQTDLLTHPLGDALLESPLPVAGSDAGRNRLTAPTFAARTEALLTAGDVPGAVRHLAARPGELTRRLQHLLRVHDRWLPWTDPPAELLDALPDALRRVAPGPLLGALGRLRADRPTGERRLCFPPAGIARVPVRDPWLDPLPERLRKPVRALLEAELLRRASAAGGDGGGSGGGEAGGDGGGDAYELAVIDEELADLPVPTAVRTAARSLVRLPRGSVRALPEGARLRLFLHWTQPRGLRIDLDLSPALYDEDWHFQGLCDYTHLVHGRRAAVHSGDLTSAPPPHGATEFVDLDLAELAADGTRYAVPVVFAYNDIPFDRLTDAFAGFMELTPAGTRGRERFDPRAVRQRYDLAGNTRVGVPLVVDLRTRRYTWTDASLGAVGGRHNLRRHSRRIGRLAADLLAHYGDGGRATLWDLAAAVAAGWAGRVVVRRRDGALTGHLRRPGETAAEFRRRLDGPGDPLPAVELAGRRALFALTTADLPPAPGLTGTAYRLHPGPLDAAALTLGAFEDLLALLHGSEG